jgi:hypothetical protein
MKPLWLHHLLRRQAHHRYREISQEPALNHPSFKALPVVQAGRVFLYYKAIQVILTAD